jgi:tetratricopeptide (TPR) repeat protein
MFTANPKDIPHNVAYRFDRDLREVPVDRKGMTDGVLWLLTRMADASVPRDERARMASMVGVFQRILGQLEEAAGYLQWSIAEFLALGLGELAFIARIRLAHVLQWQKKFPEADAMFEELTKECRESELLRPYLDFVVQHYGKSMFDQGRFPEAEAMFSQALELRQSKADVLLVASAVMARDEARRRMTGAESARH